MNLIQQLSLESRTSSRAVGERISEQLPDLITDIIFPRIDECFNEIAPDLDLRIDCLECDLGTISLRDLKTQLPNLLVNALENHFRGRSSGRAGIPSQYLPKEAPFPSIQLVEKGRTTQSSHEAQLEAFLYVLTHGHFPWWFSEDDWPQLSQLESWPDPELETLRATLIETINQERTSLLHRFFRHISPETSKALASNSSQVKLITTAEALSSIERHSLFILAWLCNSSSGEVPITFTTEKFLHLSDFQSLSSDARQLATTLFPSIKDISQADECQPASQNTENISGNEMIEKEDHNRDPTDLDEPRESAEAGDESIETVDAKATLYQSTGSSISSPEDGTSSNEKNPSSLTSQTRDVVSIEQFTQEKPLLVSNAGLILLHPFIPRIFDKLGWTDAEGKLHSDQRWSAIQTLQYLCRGETGLAEPTLVLEKILCGIPIADPAEFPTLSPSAREECNSLLEAVIKHWSALKNTSPDGLREGFLKRPGFLFQIDGQWQLKVEKQTIDILLESIPWGIKVLKFPWLEKPLLVQWMT